MLNSENLNFQPDDLDLRPKTVTFQLIRDIVKVSQATKFSVNMQYIQRFSHLTTN